MPAQDHVVRLEFPSVLEMVDLAETVGSQVGRHLALDEDAIHWLNVALREAVVNAIEHGNGVDASKSVTVEFVIVPAESPSQLVVKVRDCGEGFDARALADPLARENLAKGSGRGVFLMRRLMDDVRVSRTHGGAEVRMVKRLRARVNRE